MSVLARPGVAAVTARVLQALAPAVVGTTGRRRGKVFPECPGTTRQLTIPTSIAPARAVVYRPSGSDRHPPVHVNLHGGGYVMRGAQYDDPLCRYLAAVAGVVVVNVDYVVAPQHRFPAAPRQVFEVVRWVAEHGTDQGWDGYRLTVGGQSAGGALAAAAARQAWEQGGPAIALQVLHYAPLDLVTDVRDKRSVIDRPVLRPWLGDIFDNAYVPERTMRADRLVSPAGPADDSDLTGIAPGLVITAEYDVLRAEGQRYAQRLREAGALVAHRDVPQVDHAYDIRDIEQARQTYAVIAQHVRQATRSAPPATT
ncbi:alpha/beta hydrolase fold domain-containing protein [Micromonospora sp. KC721]|uniref:alpha/beta hydrolase fold domain-containing protein n=1 Tax=Micromonospora sp. KC721 TaxID=2530380 RepID=UPI0010524AEA|nr:alpha/beta hydrolase fold domain-containing protein [Micromonospora sp. KC721]TDB77734.1 alpha/beta hydrolase [Micromonospora sp. KC721]